MALRRYALTAALCLFLPGCGKEKDADTNRDKTAKPTTTEKPTLPPEKPPKPPDAKKPDAKKPDAKPPDAKPPVAKAPTLYFDRALTKAELSDRPLRELALMRNTIFARGGNTFRKKWLRDHFTAQDWYKPADTLDKSKISSLDWSNIKTIAEVERSFSKEQLNKRKTALLAAIGDGAPSAEQRVELALVSRRVGQWVGSDKIAVSDRSPLEDPTRLDQLLDTDSLYDMSRKDLRILRNTIYARRGNVFKSAILQDYFDHMVWYNPDDSFSEKRFSSVDWKNIKLIKSVENDLGGPMGDEEQEDLYWLDAA